MPAPSDLVYQQSTSTGTGNLTLAAVNGRRTFATAFGTGATLNVFTYFIAASSGSSYDEWEIGTGHMSNSTTLVRDTVIASSNANAAVSFSGGILDVTNDIRAANQVYNDGSTVTDGDIAVFDGTSGRKLKASGYRGRNRLVNPSFYISQIGVGSITDGSYSGIDQWYVLTQTAAVASSQLTNVADGVPSMGRLTQSQATAQRMGWAQVLENGVVSDLRGKTVVLAAKARMSAATTLRFAIIEWNGTADTITKDVVNSWANTTFTAGQFFASSNLTIAATGSIALSASTLTDISLSASISSSMNNIIAFFWTDSAQAQTVTLDLGNVFFGQGASAPATFDPPDLNADLLACQRYFETTFSFGVTPADNVGQAGTYFWISPVTTTFSTPGVVRFLVRKRTSPTITFYNPSATNSNKIWDATTSTSKPAIAALVNTAGFQLLVNNSSVSAGDSLYTHFTTDARL